MKKLLCLSLVILLSQGSVFAKGYSQNPESSDLYSEQGGMSEYMPKGQGYQGQGHEMMYQGQGQMGEEEEMGEMPEGQEQMGEEEVGSQTGMSSSYSTSGSASGY